MKAKEMEQKFQEGLKLWNDGSYQECVNIWDDLAERGHLVAIEQLVYIFLGQRDFDAAEEYIECAHNPSEAIILYLKARVIEERDGRDTAMEYFKTAASAGNPNANLLMFKLAIKNNNLEVAKKHLDKLRGYDHLLSIMNEPTTFEALNQKLESRVQYFNEMAKLRAQDKVFTIAVGSDETNTFLEVRVYAYYDQQYVRNFGDDLISAVEFCGSKDRGFEVIYVGDSWDLDTTDIVYRCKVNWSENKITISANYEDYWFGELSDMYSAVEELIEKEFDWELVNYFLAEDDEDDEDDDLVICSMNLHANRLRNGSNINPEIKGLNSFLISFEKNTGDGFLNINYEESIEGLWIPMDPNNVDAFLKSVIHLALILGYGQPGYEVNEGLPGNFPDLATSWQSPELVVWLDSLTIESDVDQAFLCLLEYLTEWANEVDPGWTFILSGQGLRMSSIWTEESDIWDDREFREALPVVDMQALREIWKRGEPGGDCSFPTPRLDNHMDTHLEEYF